jgi:guanylate kinase
MKKIKLFAIVGKSGAGKDTILRETVEAAPEVFHEIISCTTRPPRDNEIDGVNYYFITPEIFRFLKDSGEMLEWAKFNDWIYGTEKAALNPEKVNIGVFNPEGIISLMNRDDIDLTIIYIIVGNKIRMLRQLNREINPDVKEIVRRFNTDEHDFVWIDKFAHQIFTNETELDKKMIVDNLVYLGKLG